MLPLPASPAIAAGNPALLPTGVVTDERGVPGTSGAMMDLGAVQTHYAAVEFVQQPTTMAVNTDISPSGMVSVTENGSTALNVPVTLTLAGPGALAGTTTAAIVVQPGIMAGSMNGPILAYRIPLAYPAGAKSLHMRGDVVLHAVIDKQGRLAEIQPVGGQAVFVDSAVRAVSQ